ncbi:hypothetical protein DH96_01215 [Candidatus Phytoplasma oryzae]|uniref:Uncharacterized protein n=2 Tax=Candidatus Phytoplasma oryzae TaxID=203274 RepID=A0A328II06_9MOLU|nr:hypothetical protein DH96_01215 [Candidatus Phytoplasma oryzae]
MHFNSKKIPFNFLFLFIIFLFLIFNHNLTSHLIYAGPVFSRQVPTVSLEQEKKIQPLQNKIYFLLKEQDLITKELFQIETKILYLQNENQQILLYSEKNFKLKSFTESSIFHLINKKYFFKRRIREILLEKKFLENQIKEILKFNNQNI